MSGTAAAHELLVRLPYTKAVPVPDPDNGAMLQRQAFAYGAICPVKYNKKPQNVKANQTLVWREFVINTKATGSLGNTPLMIARVVGLASDEKEALRGSVFLQCDQASAASIRCTGFHFRLA